MISNEEKVVEAISLGRLAIPRVLRIVATGATPQPKETRTRPEDPSDAEQPAGERLRDVGADGRNTERPG
jgi:hypothetical protein